jgi:hypothetical protein
MSSAFAVRCMSQRDRPAGRTRTTLECGAIEGIRELNMPDEEKQIRTLIEQWATAVHCGDMDGVLAHHAHDIVMFDLCGRRNDRPAR